MGHNMSTLQFEGIQRTVRFIAYKANHYAIFQESLAKDAPRENVPPSLYSQTQSSFNFCQNKCSNAINTKSDDVVNLCGRQTLRRVDVKQDTLNGAATAEKAIFLEHVGQAIQFSLWHRLVNIITGTGGFKIQSEAPADLISY